MKTTTLQLQESLALHTKMGDPRKLASSLREATFLSSIQLDPILSRKMRPVEKQAAQESAIINGVRTVAASNYFGCLRILKDLSFQLCQMNELSLDPQTVYESIILRMSRSISASDAYLKLKKIIKSCNLSLIRGDDTWSRVLPIEVDIFESQGSLQAVVSTMSSFGVVRNAELSGKAEINSNGFLVPRKKAALTIDPWVKFDVLVTERINLSTGDSQRIAKVV